MSDIIRNYTLMQKKITDYALKYSRDPKSINLLAVAKQQPVEKIECLMQMGHRLFGENRVQEAKTKWLDLKKKYPDTILHFIGPLQTNKISDAVALFDVIESIDRLKLAEKLFHEEQKQKKTLRYFVQVNIGHEPQKSGVLPEKCDELIVNLRRLFPLIVDGVMCIPPVDEDPTEYFLELVDIAKRNNLKNISMGMSNDYEKAIAVGATIIRIGRAIFHNQTINISDKT